MSVRSAEEIVVHLLARTDKLERSLAQAERTTDHSLGKMEERGKSFAGKLTGLLAGVSTVALAGQFLKLADAAKSMDAQLRLATATFGSFGQAQKDVERIAAATRIGLEASTKLYANFVRAAQPIGKSQADAAAATENFAKALKIGGASAEEASSATLQFSQSLASGVLAGDEFRVLTEASPSLLQLFADALGVPRGALKKLASEGKLTSEVLFNALTNTNITAGLTAEFEQLPVTMGDAMQLVEDATVKLAGAFDEGSGLSNAIAGLVGRGTDGFNSLADSGFEAGAKLRGEFVGIAGAWDDAVTTMENAASKGTGGIVDRFLAMRRAVVAEIFQARDAVAGLLTLVDRVNNVPIGGARLVQRGFNYLASPFTGRPDTVGLSAYSDYAGRYRARRDDAIGSRDALRDENNGHIAGALQRMLDAQRRQPARAAGPAIDGKALAQHQETLAGLQTRLAAATGKEHAAIERRIARENSIIASLNRGLSSTQATAAAPGSGGGGRGGAGRRKPAEKPFVLTARDRRQDGPHFDLSDVFDAREFAEGLESARDEVRRTVEQMIEDKRAFIAANPIRAFQEQLHDDVDNINAALQQVEVNGLQTLEDGLVGVISGTESVGKAFSDMARSIVADLARIAIRQAILGGLNSVLSSNGGGIGGFLGSVFGGTRGKSGTDSVSKGGTPIGLATGGSILIGGNAGVDNNMLAINGQPIARVSRGETLHVNTAARAARQSSAVVHQHFSIDMRGALTTPQLMGELQAYVDESGRQVHASAVETAGRQAPARVAQAQRFRG